MDIKELKNKIENKSLDSSTMVWLLSDYSSEIIAEQYIKLISEYKKLHIKYIESFDEVASRGFIEDDNLYVYKEDKLEDFKNVDNCIILCNKTNYKDAVKIPKLQPWQFVDYLVTKVPGMNKVDIEWLITQYETTDSRVTEVNYRRLENDLDKIAIFDTSLQNMIFNELYNDGEYNTISNLTIFDLTTAIIKKDTQTALTVMKVLDYIDSKPHVWLLSILLNNFRNIIAVQANPNVKAEDLGISDKQLWVIKKYNTGYYDMKQLIDIYETLTNVEYMYKFGCLNMNNLSDYLLVKILGA